MKSSGPVFTRQNLPTSRVGKPQYHPPRAHSQLKKVNKKKLSPVQSKQQSNPNLHNLGPESPQQFGKSERSFDTTNGQLLFTESWPSTECESSPTSSATTSDMAQSSRARKSSLSTEFGVQQDPVLAKYIERFRHGRPQSREERQLTDSEKQPPFWWMSASSLPPASKDTDVIQCLTDNHRPAIFSPATERQRHRSLSPCRGSLSFLSDMSQDEMDDPEILHLQERADRLLLRDECTLSDGSAHVSSTGLGCSDFSSPGHVDESLPRCLPQTTEKASAGSDSTQAVTSQISLGIPSLVHHTRPEEDILFQWRLRRKIEQAQSLQHPTLHGPTWNTPIFNHPSASGQVYKQQQSTRPVEFPQKGTQPHAAAPLSGITDTSCPPASNPHPFPGFTVAGSSDAHPQAIAHVPAHMHLLCDVLPCPMQSSYSRGQHSSQDIDEFPTKFDHKKTQVPGDSVTVTNKPISEHILSPSPAIRGATEAHQHNYHKGSEKKKKERGQIEESERKIMMSVKKQKKPRCTAATEHTDVTANRISSNHKVPTKVTQKGSQESSDEGFSGHYRPSPSPVHSALGQVVSEVLFPTVDPSPAQRTPVASGSPPCTSPTPLPSSGPPADAQNSMEVISQLLQEAEGSDEEEFEDDPLLQVLRKQRTWVKQQICEVDSMLNELMDEQHVTTTLARNT